MSLSVLVRRLETPTPFPRRMAMHRDHVWIPKLLRLQILLLFVLAPVVWGQSYYVRVSGTATTCGGTAQYKRTAKLDVFQHRESNCGTSTEDGSAAAASGADFEEDLSDGNLDISATNSESSGLAQSITYDTVTLIPPKGYNESSVTFTINDVYDITIENQGGSGSAQVCWIAAKLWAGKKCYLRHASDNADVTIGATLSKSASGFKFAIEKSFFVKASVSGTSSWSGVYSTPGDPAFGNFQETGWSCTFASGGPCIVDTN